MKVLNLHHHKEKTPHDTFIGRGSPAGNPFAMSSLRNDRGLAVALHKEYFLSQLANSTPMIKFIWEIPIDNNLLCYCHPKSCHGDLIKEFREETVGMSFKEARQYFLKKHDYVFLPMLEGKTFINIYSKSNTELGQLCSNFAFTPFEHPQYGKFNSVEGFWFYVGTGFKCEELRLLHGAKAKSLGSTLPKEHIDNFEQLIQEAIHCKVDQNPRLKQLLTENHLPFKHFYVYGQPDNCKTVKEGNGLLERTFSEISRSLGESHKVIIAGSRDIKDVRWLVNLITESKFRISEVVEGGARGVDTFGMYYASINHIPYKTFEVTSEQWKQSKGAGMLRNIDMGNYADKAIIGIKDQSKGSTQMAEYMKKLGKEAYVKDYTK